MHAAGGDADPATLEASRRPARLTATAIQSLLNSQFPAFSARAFQAVGWNGTFVAMNDGVAGYNANTDSIVLLQNYNLVLAAHPIVLV
ncbi:MAG: hypothetical protein RLZZ117_337 [Cyanobacteriota bacterium]